MPFWELAPGLTQLKITGIFTSHLILTGGLIPIIDGDDEEACEASKALDKAARLECVQLEVEASEDDEDQLAGAGTAVGVLEDDLGNLDVSDTSHAESLESIRGLHLSIAARTVTVAARGGQLTTLDFETSPLHTPYAVRTLLPFWIDIESWTFDMHEYEIREDDWSGILFVYWAHAAATLRHVLAYASRHLITREDRLLTCEDVRALLRHSDDATFKQQAYHSIWYHSYNPDARDTQEAYIKIYLRWLAEDAELAQQVANAWNAVVERGEADLKIDISW